MRVLLDEDVPVQLLEPLQHLTAGRHVVDHVTKVKLSGKKDRPLFRVAKERGYEAVVTNDWGQLNDPQETKAIAASGLHHIRYAQKTKLGRKGLALALGALVASLPLILDELAALSAGQQLVRVEGLDPNRKHYRVTDPKVDPPPYWPRRQPRGASQST
jgi:hypothetical protein